MSATVVIGPATAGYGRHAAPLSAYGPADVHRVLPEPLLGAGRAQPEDGGDIRTNSVDEAIRAEDTGASNPGAASNSVSDRTANRAGFWTRLRLLPKAA